MRILVTGGSGLVGKYIVDELLQHRHIVDVLDLKTPNKKVKHHCIDVLNLEGVVTAMSGYDAVVHMAGIPHPLNDPAEKIFSVNVNGTFNVLEAAARNKVNKVVFTSSESTLGFAFMTNRIVPDYIPIDELHPLRPQDPYGMSKVIGEQICRTYSARYGIHTVCLRAPWIWVPEGGEREKYKQLIVEHYNWYRNLWSFVHVYDAAQAHRLALENDLSSVHEVFFISAEHNWTGTDSRVLLETHFPEVKKVARDFAGPASILSYGKAKDRLGYVPRHSVRDILF